jgi:hypothetical protein
VALSDLAASSTGRELSVSGSNTITLANVLVGDVWLCSGQSNMEWTLGGCNAPEDIQSAVLPLIRWFRVPLTCAESPLADIQSEHPLKWSVCDPGNAGGISAVGFRIKGALWYQGESNGGEGDSYFVKKRALIGSWRRLWAEGDFPFYFVQLANFQQPSADPAGGDGWAKLRMAQSKTLTVPHTGMAVAIDLADADNPDDIHPKNKQDVGGRGDRWRDGAGLQPRGAQAGRGALRVHDEPGNRQPLQQRRASRLALPHG